MKKIILILILVLVITNCDFKKDKPKEEEPTIGSDYQDSKVSLVAFGDNLIHDTIYKSAKLGDSYDFSKIFIDVKRHIKDYDLKFINQETILGGTSIGLSTYPAFNSPEEVGDALVDSGFNLISLANNHTLDRGERAIKNSVNFWSNQNVIYSGSELSDVSHVKTFEKNGIKFAFVAYTYGTNGIKHPDGKMYLANLYDDAKAKKDIDSIKTRVDVIIVSMHWGEEYQDLPSNKQLEQAKYLNGLGVDIIIGHHPHVIQPIDVLTNSEGEKTIVIYSLGNFLSDQKGIDRLIGMGVSLDIKKVYDKDLKDGSYKIAIDNINAKLIYRHKDSNSQTFRVLLFLDLNDDLLLNYEEYFSKKEKLIKTYYNDIIVN